MSVRNSTIRLKRLKWQVLSLTVLTITALVTYFYLYRNISFYDIILGWATANAFALILIWISFFQLEKVQAEINISIKDLEKQTQREAAIAQLGKGFTTTYNETQICAELIERLQSVHGYDYVAVFIVDQSTGNRILHTESLKDELPPTPVLRPGEGLSERPILDGKLHYSPDITIEKAHVPGLTQGSEIDVPIEFAGEVLGVIVVESFEIDAFNSFDFEMLTIAADQAALALKNAHLLTREKDRRQQAEVLYRATSTLTSALELDQVLEKILDQLRQVIDHDSASIFIQEGSRVRAVAASGFPETENLVGQYFPEDNPLFQLVLQQEEPVILDNTNLDPRFDGWGGSHEMRSWMGIPLIFLDKIIGYLTLDSRHERAYTAEHANLAQVFANQAAIAIENARLFRSTKGLSDRQKLLYQLSQKMIQAGMDLEQIYQSVHSTTAHLMPTDAFVISILSENEADIVATYLSDKGVREGPRRLPFGEGLSGYIIKTGKPLLAFDYYKQQELHNVNFAHYGSDDHIRSIIAVPMLLGNKVIGMLSAQTYEPHDYTLDDQHLLEMLAAYTAIAINNSQLFGEIQRLAITDSLTGTFNRRYFFEAAQQEINRSHRYDHPISVMMLDLDNYKEINDTYGHDIGDQALQLIAQRCQENIRDVDILARYGGDEFIFLLPETNITQALEIAERLRLVMQDNPIEIGEISATTTISIGVAGSIDASPELDLLLKRADLALYDAKHSGRNCIKTKPEYLPL